MLTEEDILIIIRDWKRAWSKEYGYFARALGIDANMAWDLAKRIREEAKKIEGKSE
jgi:hypothetical protein